MDGKELLQEIKDKYAKEHYDLRWGQFLVESSYSELLMALDIIAKEHTERSLLNLRSEIMNDLSEYETLEDIGRKSCVLKIDKMLQNKQ